MLPRPLASLTLCAALAATVFAAQTTEPTLGKRGRLLLEEKFEAAAIPAGWVRTTGELSIADGALRSRELQADKHAAAFRKPLPLQDCVIEVDVKLDRANTFNLGFDPAPGQLKKKGHLFSVVIANGMWSLVEHVDKADPQSKNKIHARAATTFPKNEWFTLVVEVKGNDVVARVAGKEPLRASAPDFHVRKPGLVFRVGGKGEHAALIDNVKVWELL